MKTMLRMHAYVKDMSVYIFVPLVVVLSIIVVFPVKLVITDLYGPMGEPYSDTPLWTLLVLGCVVAPLFETAVFQALPIHLLARIKKLPRFYIATISAALFGASHYFSVSYLMVTFLIGLLLAYAYMVYLPKRQSAFLVVSVIHALRNLVSVFEVLASSGAS